ncbi:MAG: hypothetical protein OXL37_08170 [Chloroflexota bacterium]|nr:hypothetical protein [Chloroflexota bacterium]MDE2958637.1 hypothetical protein [Chloroflexota bacterium]
MKPAARPPVGRLLFFAVIAALSAAIASGSCSLHVGVDAIETGERSIANFVLISVLFPAGLALAIGSLYLLLNRKPPAARLFAIIAVAAYVAGMVGAWWMILLIPAILSLMVIVAGGLICRFTDELGYHTYRSWPVAVASGLAIAAATFGFVAGFWVNFDIGTLSFDGSGTGPSFNALPFALVAGSVPPLCAAAGSWICCLLIDNNSRRWSPR